jgi:hypothetical protein
MVSWVCRTCVESITLSFLGIPYPFTAFHNSLLLIILPILHKSHYGAPIFHLKYVLLTALSNSALQNRLIFTPQKYINFKAQKGLEIRGQKKGRFVCRGSGLALLTPLSAVEAQYFGGRSPKG